MYSTYFPALVDSPSDSKPQECKQLRSVRLSLTAAPSSQSIGQVFCAMRIYEQSILIPTEAM